MKNIRITRRVVLLIDILLLVIAFFCYKYIFKVETNKLIYADETEKFVSGNVSPVFKIERIVLYSSANWIDNSNEKLRNIDISQFTDIEIFINNKTKNDSITAENTISKLYIDNIKIECSSEEGERILNYKNPLNSGKYVDLVNYSNEEINFTVPLTNEENSEVNYDENVFYTDCSNPISLGYINKNILTGCTVDGTNASIENNGTILQMAGIDISELEAKISFSIHLVNNYNEEFVCNLIIDNDLTSTNEDDEGIYNGYLMKVIDTSDEKYNFLKVK